MPERRPRTSLVVPLFNSSVYTRVFLLALREVLPGEPPVEVVLVDNASTDDTPQVLGELAGKHRVVSLPVNHHFAGGCNRGAAAAQGELLFFVNNDMVPTPGFVSAAVRTIDGDETIAAVGSKLLFPGGRIQHAGIVFGEGAAPRHRCEFLPADHPAASDERDLQAVTGAALLVHRAEFEAVGGFDTAYRNSFEDLDLCLRLRERGRRVVYCPKSVLYHFRSSSHGRHDWDDENFRRFYTRWHGAVEADAERQDVGDPGADSLARGLSVTAEIHQLLADGQCDARAWRTRFEALEERTRTAERVAEASGDVPRILHVACPESLAEGSGRTLSVLVSPGAIRSEPLTLSARWSDETAAAPARIELSAPFAPTMHVRLPVRAPAVAGRHELTLHLGSNGSDGPPAWRGTITVRPLYGATYRAEVPARLAAGDAVVVPVYVTNEGMVAWEGPDFRLSYHWRDAGSGAVVQRDGWRTYLPHAVAPGEGVSLRARVETPCRTGSYDLEWDMVIEGILWFSDHGVPTSSHRVQVCSEIPAAATRAGRLE